MHAAQLAAILVLAPLVQGAMTMLKARLNGRPGPSPLQPYRNLRKLLRKEALVARGTSPIALAMPGLSLGAAITVAALVPAHDAIAIALTLALGRCAIVLAALDTRSAFEGMAASREMTFAALTEAPLILAIAALGWSGGSALPGVLACGALLVVALAETARVPVDNQETHYELTMIHEGLTLEYSGWHLALLQYAAQVRQLALYVLAAMLLPGEGIVTIGWVAVIAVLVPSVERSFAKLRLFEVPALFGAALVLAFTSIALRIAGIGA
jgi:formate hydrogenlyase subunit 4